MKARFKLEGATCTGCRIAIDHYLQRDHRIDDMNIDTSSNSIYVEFNDDSILNEIPDFIKKLGYNAELKERT